MTEHERELLEGMDAVTAARRLLGCELVRTIESRELRVRIVETEAYDQTDAASHSYNGRTQRADVMFGPAGHLYVYFTYGMHHCCNIVAGEEGFGSGVLIRAAEPIEGLDVMEVRRGRSGHEMTNGPAKLCQALGIDRRLNGHDLAKSPMRLEMRPALPAQAVTATTRIGISKAADMPWRFYVTDSGFVSKR